MQSDSFGLIRDIKVDDPSSWSQLFLSFDIDWAHDGVLRDTIELVRPFSSKITWYATHSSSLLDEIRQVCDWELGAHPNFNPLLDCLSDVSAPEVIKNLLSIVPEARSLRSHSLVQSSRLGDLFVSSGITHDSNDYIPCSSKIELRPFTLENGLVKVPYYFSDELWCKSKRTREDFLALTRCTGLRVFDFHPIHVFLNTEDISRYEMTRPFHRNPKELMKYRYKGYGTRDRLIDLLSMV
ncbi:MAG TPA: hypothetical protein VE934_07820 [Polaromonas sp.]|uniref:polysaccharide deacetylase WbmS family protein n=1 Tax=Polaromonas sp. TaxID=1869339 RepID=UPI002D46DF44|nr:hypothetical protein [Polaromonas sp.]HYW56852.1 hypothetical protein [Polaromonas sp.]